MKYKKAAVTINGIRELNTAKEVYGYKGSHTEDEYREYNPCCPECGAPMCVVRRKNVYLRVIDAHDAQCIYASKYKRVAIVNKDHSTVNYKELFKRLIQLHINRIPKGIKKRIEYIVDGENENPYDYNTEPFNIEDENPVISHPDIFTIISRVFVKARHIGQIIQVINAHMDDDTRSQDGLLARQVVIEERNANDIINGNIKLNEHVIANVIRTSYNIDVLNEVRAKGYVIGFCPGTQNCEKRIYYAIRFYDKEARHKFFYAGKRKKPKIPRKKRTKHVFRMLQILSPQKVIYSDEEMMVFALDVYKKSQMKVSKYRI